MIPEGENCLGRIAESPCQSVFRFFDGLPADVNPINRDTGENAFFMEQLECQQEHSS